MIDPIKYKQLKEKYQDEQVFIIPTLELTHIPDLYTHSDKKSFQFHSCDNKGKFIFRYDAEGNGSFQQIIPYALIHNPKTDKYFVSIRTKQSGEARLYDKISIGFGGHINPCDGPNNIIWNGLLRELSEELIINDELQIINYEGTIRNITSELNDHLGFVFCVEAQDVAIKETDKLIGKWMSVEELIDNYTKLEDWAKFIVDYMYQHNNKLD